MIAAITGLVCLIQKLIIKYKKQNTKLDHSGELNTNIYEDCSNPQICTSLVTGSINETLALKSNTDNNNQPIETKNSSTLTNDNVNHGLVHRHEEPALRENPVSSSVVVVDIENDDQDTWKHDRPHE